MVLMIIITSYHCETKLHIGMTVLFLSRFHFYVISHYTKTGICVIKLTESCDGPSSGIFVADDVEGASPRIEYSNSSCGCQLDG